MGNTFTTSKLKTRSKSTNAR